MDQLKLFDPPRLYARYVPQVLNSKHLTTGPMVEHLRREVASRFDVEHDRVVLGSSATACGYALMDMLARLYGPDIRIDFDGPATWPLFLKYAYRQGYNQHTRDVRCVNWWTDIGGSPARRDWSTKDPVARVHDACHSFEYDDETTPADFTIMSFYPTKLSCGAEGGLVICKDTALTSELQQILNCGMSSRSWEEMKKFARSWDYPIHPLAVKANMSDVQAALNIEGLEKAEEHRTRTLEAWNMLANEIMKRSDRPEIWQRKSPYLFQILVNDVPRARDWFKKQGLPTAWSFSPFWGVTLPCHYREPRIVEHIAGLVVNYYRFEEEVSK